MRNSTRWFITGGLAMALGFFPAFGGTRVWGEGQDRLSVQNPSFEEGIALGKGWSAHPGIREGEDRSVRVVKGAAEGKQAVEIRAGADPVANQWVLQDIPAPQ